MQESWQIAVLHDWAFSKHEHVQRGEAVVLPGVLLLDYKVQSTTVQVALMADEWMEVMWQCDNVTMWQCDNV